MLRQEQGVNLGPLIDNAIQNLDRNVLKKQFDHSMKLLLSCQSLWSLLFRFCSNHFSLWRFITKSLFRILTFFFLWISCFESFGSYNRCFNTRSDWVDMILYCFPFLLCLISRQTIPHMHWGHCIFHTQSTLNSHTYSSVNSSHRASSAAQARRLAGVEADPSAFDAKLEP